MDLKKILASLSLEQKIGQLIVAGFETGSPEDPHFLKLVRDYHVGNIILFTRNLGERQQTAELTQGIRNTIMEDCGVPPFIAVDQEGGMVTRIFHAGTVIPGAMALSSTFDTHNAYLAGSIAAKEMRALGMNFNLAPCTEAALEHALYSMGVRSYSNNPYMIAAFAKEFVRGMQEHGVIGTLKHFPGYTGCRQDGHLVVPTSMHSRNELDKIEFNTYRMALQGGADAVMAAHMLCPALVPEHRLTSASREVITGILKEEMGFEGLIISDCLDMHSVQDIYGAAKGAVEFIKAGIHLLDISHTLGSQAQACDALKEAVLSGEIPMEMLDEIVLKILTYKEKYHLFEERSIEDRLNSVDWEEDERICQEISKKSITVMRDDNILPLPKRNGLFISTLPITLVIVEENINSGNTFAAAAAEYFGGTAREIPLDPTPEEIEALAQEAKDKDYVVFGSYNSFAEPGQQKLKEALLKANPRVVGVALRQPYDYDCSRDLPCFIFGYEYTRLSIRSIISVLAGETKATGMPPFPV